MVANATPTAKTNQRNDTVGDDNLSSQQPQEREKAYKDIRQELVLREMILDRDFQGALHRLEEYPEEAFVLVEIRVQGRLVLRHMAIHEVFLIDMGGTGQSSFLNDASRSNDRMPNNQVQLILQLLQTNPRACIQKELQDKRTPLHLALASPVVPPRDVIAAMIRAYPSALKALDAHHRLPLHAATSNPMTSFENIKAVVKVYPDAVDTVDDEDQLPIHLAAWGGSYDDAVDTIRLLVEENPNENPTRSTLAKDSDDETVVSLMARYGRTSEAAVRYILELDTTAGTRVHDERENNSLLHFAVMAASIRNGDIYKPILEKYPELASKINAVGKTPLHAALWQCCPVVSLIRYLLTAFPQAASNRDGLGYLPLHYAVNGGVDTIEIVEMLLETDPRTIRTKLIPPKQTDGPLPLHLALRHPSFEGKMYEVINDIVFLLMFRYHEAAKKIDPDRKVTPLQSAVGSRRPARVLRRMISLVPDAVSDMITVEGQLTTTAFHLFAAISTSYMRPDELKDLFVDFLQADPDAMTRLDSNGRTPLHQLWENAVDVRARKVLFDLMMKEGVADTIVSIQDKSGKTALFYAAQARDSGAIQELLRRHPEAAKQMAKDGTYPLHELCARGQDGDLDASLAESFQLLIDAFPDAAAHKRTEDENLPLHLLAHSVGYDHVPREAIDKLIAAYPTALTTENKEGQLPIHCMIFPLTADEVYPSDGPYWVAFVQALLDANPAVASIPDRQGKPALQKIVHTMDSLSNIRRHEDDYVLQVLKLLYDQAPQVVELKNKLQRNTLHAVIRLVGDTGGMTTESWRDFAVTLMRNHPHLLKDQDKAQRLPLHLLALYLGDTAVVSRENQNVKTLRWTPNLDSIVFRVIAMYPEGIEIQDQFNMTAFDILDHERIVEFDGGKAYKNSLIISTFKRYAQRSVSYWKLAGKYYKLEQKVLFSVEDCNEIGMAVDEYAKEVKEAMAQWNLSSRSRRTEADVETCSEREGTCQRSTCPEEASILKELLADLRDVGNAQDRQREAIE